MKLATKLMLVFLAAVMLMTAVGSYFSVRRGFERFEQRQRRVAREAADAMDEHLAQAWRQGGAEGLFAAMETMPSFSTQHRFRWVWFEKAQLINGRPSTRVVEQIQIDDDRGVSRSFTDQDGKRHLQTYYAVDLGVGPRGGLEVTGSLESLDSAARETITTALISLGAMGSVSLAIAYVAGIRWIARPLDQLIAKTQRIGRGDFSQPLAVRGNDELSQLAQALNEMSAQLAEQQQRIHDETSDRSATLEQLRHADRLKTVGRLAAGIAHELGTPLNVVSGRAGLIASGKLSADEVAASAKAIKTEADRVAAIIRQLLDFARPAKSQRKPLEVEQVLQQTVDLIEPLAEKKNVSLKLDMSPGAVVSADRSQMQQVFTNLMVNAAQSMPDGGTVTASVQPCDAHPPDQNSARVPCIAISIRDQGIGIEPEHREHIFEPFYTTKDVGEGTGLGLSIAYGIVQEHGGWIDVESEPGHGSCFTVCLPRSNDA